jgi:hypothetical protein
MFNLITPEIREIYLSQDTVDDPATFNVVIKHYIRESLEIFELAWTIDPPLNSGEQGIQFDENSMSVDSTLWDRDQVYSIQVDIKLKNHTQIVDTDFTSFVRYAPPNGGLT